MKLCGIFLLLFANFGFGAKVNYLHIISEIQSRFAITDVVSQLENTANRPAELTFRATLPDAAFISNFSLELDGKVTYGDVKEKEKARRVYDAARRRGQSAGLVFQRDTNNFEISVNVGAKKSVTFNLTYQEVLKRVHGVYKHIVNVQPNGQTVDDIQVDVLIAEKWNISLLKVPEFQPRIGEKTNAELLKLPGIPPRSTQTYFFKDNKNVEKRIASTESGSLGFVSFKPSTKKADGQLVVLYDVDRSSAAGEIEVVNGYFIHFFAPENVNAGDKNVIFVLDKSGSMTGRKFEQLQGAMMSIFGQLNSKDRFNVLMFSNEVEAWKSSSVLANADNVKEASKFVGRSTAGGGTNLFGGIEKAFELLGKDESKTLVSMIVHLTDGQPTVGVQRPDEIVKKVKEMNKEKDYSIHGIGFGRGADYTLIQKISAPNKGLAKKVYEDSDAAEQLEGFYKQIATPLLREIKIKYISENVHVTSLIEENKEVYYDGSEVVAVGKLKGKSDAVSIKVSAKSSHGTKRFRASSGAILPCHRRSCCFPRPLPVHDHRPVAPRHINLCPPDDHPPTQTTQKPLLDSSTTGGFIERMWAYKTIKKLLRDSKLADEKKQQEKKKDRALKLSLKYSFVSELTSMVVVPPNQPEDKSSTLNSRTDAEESEADSFGGPVSLSLRGGPRGLPKGGSFQRGRPGGFGASGPRRSRRLGGGGGGGASISGFGARPFVPTSTRRVSVRKSRRRNRPKPTTTTRPKAVCKLDVYVIVEEQSVTGHQETVDFVKKLVKNVREKHGKSSVRVAVLQLTKGRRRLISAHRLSSAQSWRHIERQISRVFFVQPLKGREMKSRRFAKNSNTKFVLFFPEGKTNSATKLRSIRPNVDGMFVMSNLNNVANVARKLKC